MAKRKINKSEAIREFVRANGHVPTKEVVRALKAKGISVNAAMVSNVKSKAGLTRGGRGRPKKTAVRNVGRPAKSADTISLESIIQAKRFVALAGSAPKAVELIRAIEKLDAITGA